MNFIVYCIHLHVLKDNVIAVAYQLKDALYLQWSDTEASFCQVLEVSCLWCAPIGTCLPVCIALTLFLLQHSSKAN